MAAKNDSELIVVRPSPSYELSLPADVSQAFAGIVASFWRDSTLALQLSSYKRKTGEQISAAERLNDRMNDCKEEWSVWSEKVHPDTGIDQATGQFIDANGIVWLHSYLVWPYFTIYATLSAPNLLTNTANAWALKGIASIRLVS